MRFVPYARQHRDPETDAFRGLAPSAMALDEKDKGGLSVTWIEHFGTFGMDAKRLGAMAFRESLDTKHLGGKGVFATARVRSVISAGRHFGKTLRVVFDPVPGNPGHSEVRHFTDDDLGLLDALATQVFNDYDLVSDIKLPKRAKP
jgi:hypothetical protein